MGKGSGGQTTQTVQKADPWVGLQPALTELYNNALNYFNSPGAEYYPNSTLLPPGGVTQQGQQMLYDRATQGNPLLQYAQGQAASTMNGNYLSNMSTPGLYNIGMRDYSMNPDLGSLRATANGAFLNANPYVDAMFNKAASHVGQQFSNSVMPGIASMFASAGRYGSNQMADGLGQAQQNFGNTLNNLATDIYGQNYANERGFMNQASSTLGNIDLQGGALNMQALSDLGTQFGRERAMMTGMLGQIPGLANADYFDIGQLLNLGSSMDQTNQGLLNADINRFNHYQNMPMQQLQLLNQLLNGGLSLNGSTSQTTGPNTSNPLAGALGGAMMANSLGAMSGLEMLGGPWGMLGGALLGGLFS